MIILAPIAITAAMIGAGTTIAEPAAGETAWVSGGTYALGDRRIRTGTHRVYECVLAHTGRAALPEADPSYWEDAAPTQRFAPFDTYTSTAAAALSSVTYVLSPGYFNALGLYGLVGTSAAITVRDAPGGTVIFTRTVSLLQFRGGWYGFYFRAPKQLRELVFFDIPIRPGAELTIAVTSGTGQPVAIGTINASLARPLLEDDEYGGALYGATAEPYTNSSIKVSSIDGTVSIKRRTAATNVRVTVAMPEDRADEAVQAVQEVLDVPVGWFATKAPGFAGLNCFGLGSGVLTYGEPGIADLQMTIKGFP